MALLWCDSFELADTNAIRDRYESSAAVTGLWSPGRTNTGLNLGGGNIERRFSRGYQTLIIGVAKLSTSATRELIRLSDSAGTRQITLLEDGTAYKLYRGDSSTGTLLATSPAVTAGITVYIELLVTISATVGAYELKINEVSQFDGTSANTRNGAYDDIQRVQINGRLTNGGAIDCYVDDFYIADTSAPAPLGYFFGNTKIEMLGPDGNGDVIGWTGVNASNWQNVDERPHNSDTDYNYSGTVNASDLYTLSNMSASSGSVRGVQLTHVSRKDDALTRAVRPLLKTGGTVYPGSNDSLTTSYAYYYEVWPQNPATSSEWEIAAVNSLQIGIQTTS